MSGIVGSVSGKTGVISKYLDASARPRVLIYQGTFNFQYGGSTFSCGYTIPTNSAPNGHREYIVKINYSDYRWDSEMHVKQSNGYFGTGGNLYNHWNTVTISTGGVISCVNGNGGSTGDLSAELRVWLVHSPDYNDYKYAGG